MDSLQKLLEEKRMLYDYKYSMFFICEIENYCDEICSGFISLHLNCKHNTHTICTLKSMCTCLHIKAYPEYYYI